MPRQKLDRRALIATYYANVRSILEYGSVVWSGAAKVHLKRLERVQHKFLMWLAARAGGTDRSICLEYCHLLHFFHVSSLGARRTQFDLLFLKSIYSGRIDSSFLLASFALHVPSRPTRNVQLFNVPFARVSTVKTGTFTRLAAQANDFIARNPQVDFTSDTFISFKSFVVVHCRNMPLRTVS